MIKIGERDLLDFSLMLLGALIMAITFNVCYLPNNMVISGISGLSIVVNYISNIEPSTFIFIVNIFLIVLSVASLGLKSSIKSIIGALAYTLFVYLTKDINLFLNIHFDELIMYAIVGGLLTGLGAGIVFRYGYSTGGTDILTLIASKYSKLTVSKCQFVISSIIVLIGGSVFGITMIIYAVFVNYIEAMVIDKVMLGMVGAKVFYIGTDKVDEIKDFIMNDMHNGVTLLEAKDGDKNKTKYVIMTTIPSNKYFEIKNKVKEIDSEAFIMVADCYDVLGGKMRR